MSLRALLRRLTARRPLPRRQLRILDGLETAVFIIDPYGQPAFGNRAARDLAGGSDSLAAWLYDAPFHDPGDRRILRPSDRPLARLRADPELTEAFSALIDAEGGEAVWRFTRTRLPRWPGWQMIHVEDGSARLHLRRSSDHANRLESIGQMSGGIAHDMSNLLGVIRLSADTLWLEDTRARTAVSAIQSACDRGTTLVDHLLSIARREDGQVTRIELGPFLSSLRELMRRTIPAHIRIELVLESPDLWIISDLGALESAFLNLAINAQNAILDSSASEGRISLGADGEGDRITLWVEDDGPGMEPAVLARAAEPFFSTRHQDGGSGLGLSMVANFAEVSGGEIAIDSTPGNGTRVSMTLPQISRQDPSSPEAQAEQAEEEQIDLTGARLLIVEDDPLFGEVLTQALRALGAEVNLATSAEPAQAAVAARPPDLLITDIVLPGPMNGHQLAQHLRGLVPELRVIYVSGYAAPSAYPGDYVPGAFLRKPVSARTMANTIALSLAPGPQDGRKGHGGR
ncbi:Signal transduction histidine kinase [Pseudooceanicola antarcticus]|uniref:histidine kinase n=1 Tax=Pseudooceanicola antarcticus TaxID=1247613 RepID=A0A285HYE4_9RHOB|nr:ATP-binding protein [Pseudooceanicola antarcticus]PJE30367.1 hypothetical protein CVM39_06570 [Pseudooceanicola antarcticus]SNY40734.1 Signal transduction histidine kinase [Pseudooceanicola antarcticus]